MIIDIEKIIVKDRIRKDFGDIQELADDIQQNGLINPPVVNKEYELLAGERRLRACKSLGWKQIEVRMMDTRDAEHELEIEISENEVRKEFSRAERIDYAKRLERIESAKARTRMGESGGNISTPEGKTRDIVATKMGIGSGKQYEKEKYVVEHQAILEPEDFADWDEGRLSTNKAYQKIKAELAAKEERIAELEADKDKPSVKDKFYENRIKNLGEKNESLKARVVELEQSEFDLKEKLEELESTQPEPETVEIEVVPEDYEQSKRDAKHFRELANTNKASYDELMAKYTKKCNEALELQDQIADLKQVTQEGLEHGNLSENVFYFCSLANNFVGNVGGLVWLTERIADMPEKERGLFLKAARALGSFSQAFIQNLERVGIEYEEGSSRTDTAVPLLPD
jgi:ParB family chromosome partitioning protein